MRAQSNRLIVSPASHPRHKIGRAPIGSEDRAARVAWRVGGGEDMQPCIDAQVL